MKTTQIVILISLLLYMGRCFAEFSTAPTQTPATLWHGLYPLGNEKTAQDQKVKQSFYELSRLFQTMDEWRLSMYRAQSLQPLWKELREDIQDYTAHELRLLDRAYKQNTTNQKSSSIYFMGKWEAIEDNKSSESLAKHFEFSILDSRKNKQQSPLPLNKMGNVSAQIDLSTGSLDDNNTQIDINASMALETMMFTEMLESIESVSSLLEAEHVERVTDETNKTYTTPTQLALYPSSNHLSAFENIILANFHRSIPNMMSTLNQFTTYSSIASTKTTPLGKRYTKIQLEQHINLLDFKRSFPDTYSDFKDLLTSISTETEILTSDQLKLATFKYDATTQTFFIDINIINGGFLLEDKQGNVTNNIIYPSQLTELEYYVKTDANISMYGLDIDINNILIDSHNSAGTGETRQNRTASLSMKMTTVPNIEVHGALLYLIPYWLIDLLIPGTLETLIAEAFDEAVTGNNGQGFRVKFDFVERANMHTVVLKSAVEMPHELLQAILKIEEPEQSEQPRLYQTLRRNLREDFANTAEPYNDKRITGYLSEYID